MASSVINGVKVLESTCQRNLFKKEWFLCLTLYWSGMRSTSWSMFSMSSANFHFSSCSEDRVFLGRGGWVKAFCSSALRLENEVINLIFLIILEVMSTVGLTVMVRVDCIVCMFQADRCCPKRNFLVPRLLQ